MLTKWDILLLNHDFTTNLSKFLKKNENYDTGPKKKKKTSLHAQSACDDTSKILL